MKLTTFIWFLVIIVVLLACNKNVGEKEKMSQFFEKDTVTILVTDSGLGGLSVAADVVERLKSSGVFKKADVVFFNAQPHLESGYNDMETTAQKVAVFENALQSMYENYDPDILLIACNTLSVLYELTPFSESAGIPVVGIVETGVELIDKQKESAADQRVIIFATRTTVNQDKHRQALLARGWSAENIITQACPGLAGRIERGVDRDTTRALINKYVKQAAENISNDDTPVLVSYNCTHFPYADYLFRKAFAEQGIAVKNFLNPNPLMGDFIFDGRYLNRYPETMTRVQVVSQAELTVGKIEAISGLIAPVSPETANALLNYDFKPNLFPWRSIAEGQN